MSCGPIRYPSPTRPHLRPDNGIIRQPANYKRVPGQRGNLIRHLRLFRPAVFHPRQTDQWLPVRTQLCVNTQADHHGHEDGNWPNQNLALEIWCRLSRAWRLSEADKPAFRSNRPTSVEHGQAVEPLSHQGPEHFYPRHRQEAVFLPSVPQRQYGTLCLPWASWSA
jgi:hypothetical protein